MPNESISQYQDALRELQTATREAEAVVRVIASAGQAVARWKEVVVSNASGEGGYRLALTMNPHGVSINAREWPTAGGIHRVLVAFHDARFKVRSAWDRIPVEQQTGLTPPA